MAAQRNLIRSSRKEHGKNMAKMQEDIDNEKEVVNDLNDEITDQGEQLEKYRENMQGLRLYLEENPKYAILFLIQDLKTAKITEIHKALGTAPPITSKLVRSLEKEGWVKINENGSEMEVELIKTFRFDAAHSLLISCIHMLEAYGGT